jgi:predicted nicotinamide N-methyase
MGREKLVRARVGGLVFELATLADLDEAVDRAIADQAMADLERAGSPPEGTPGSDLCPYFGVLWPAARALAEELARRGAALAGKRVLELGCGLALPSLVAARLGARVTAADLHPAVPDYLARNLARNALPGDAVEFVALDWRAAGLGRTFDLVVSSDVLYEAGHPAPLARALAAHVAPRGEILLADPARAYLQACVDELARAGFRAELEVVPVPDPEVDRGGDARTSEVFLLALRRA